MDIQVPNLKIEEFGVTDHLEITHSFINQPFSEYFTKNLLDGFLDSSLGMDTTVNKTGKVTVLTEPLPGEGDRQQTNNSIMSWVP